MAYDIHAVEAKWRERWERDRLFATPARPARKFYVLEMFAYPSGDIHMGHFRNYTIGDIVWRYKRMRGFDLLHPFGWDAFGLPAEGAAIKRKIHPRDWTIGNIETGKKTLQRMAISYDWDREVRTCEPDYYKWTQWLFLLLFRKGWAYQAPSVVNWCEQDGILANEQCQDGRCWRCEREVVKKPIGKCWFFRYSAMAGRLLDDIDKLTGWPEETKVKQRNWIGKSVGCEIDFDFEGRPLTVFTTRPDTLWGVSFVVIAPEHPVAASMAAPEVQAYIKKAAQKNERERTAEGEKDGVFTGRFVTHPTTGEKAPLWVADYVLAHYGTGVVMGVPAHDTRDYAFAAKYGLPVKIVISGGPERYEDAYVGEGAMVASGDMTGTPSPSGIPKVIAHLEAKGAGRARTNYKLRDWLISRQRYWGCPIPILHCPKCGPQAVPEKDLPVVLPPDVTEFTPKGRSPLADHARFMAAACPACGGPAERDPDTMDTFMCSSYYLYRYADPQNAAEPWAKEEIRKWLPVDLYIGGAEHACMHLLYFRFIAKVLHDAGYVPTDEPVVRLFHQGMVHDASGQLMSKSKGNAISPSAIFDAHGVDAGRVAMAFFAPSDSDINWKDEGVVGAKKLLARVWDLVERIGGVGTRHAVSLPRSTEGMSASGRELRRLAHLLLQRATDAYETDLAFNTVVARMYELVNGLERAGVVAPASSRPSGVPAPASGGMVPVSKEDFAAVEEAVRLLVQALAPLAPHIGEELWERLGNAGSVFTAAWPDVDRTALVQDEIEIPVQVNGKVRSKLVVPAGTGEADLRERALADAKVRELAQGKAVRKVVVVPGRLVNVVVG